MNNKRVLTLFALLLCSDCEYIPSISNEESNQPTIEDSLYNSEIMSEATTSSNEIKNAIIEAFNIHNS